jgi:hypothetical protein
VVSGPLGPKTTSGAGHGETAQGHSPQSLRSTSSGAEAVIMSLWEVAGTATRQLMVEYYGPGEVERSPAQSGPISGADQEYFSTVGLAILGGPETGVRSPGGG